jgi:pimeloyl-ACP methyl ester carboxylesterase
VGHQRAVEELTGVRPPPYQDGRGFAVRRKWSNLFEGADAFLASMLGFALQAPGYTLVDVNDWLNGQIFSGQQLVPQGNAMEAASLGGAFEVPVFVFQGAEDFTTPTSLAREWVDSIQTPQKAFVPIEGGHFAAFMKPDAFLQELVALVRPLATGR